MHRDTDGLIPTHDASDSGSSAQAPMCIGIYVVERNFRFIGPCRAWVLHVSTCQRLDLISIRDTRDGGVHIHPVAACVCVEWRRMYASGLVASCTHDARDGVIGLDDHVRGESDLQYQHAQREEADHSFRNQPKIQGPFNQSEPLHLSPSFKYFTTMI